MSVNDGGYQKHAELIKKVIENPGAKVYRADSIKVAEPSPVDNPVWGVEYEYRVDIPHTPKLRIFNPEELLEHCAGRWVVQKKFIDNGEGGARFIGAVSVTTVFLVGLGWVHVETLLSDYVFVNPGFPLSTQKNGLPACGVYE